MIVAMNVEIEDTMPGIAVNMAEAVNGKWFNLVFRRSNLDSSVYENASKLGPNVIIQMMQAVK